MFVPETGSFLQASSDIAGCHFGISPLAFESPSVEVLQLMQRGFAALPIVAFILLGMYQKCAL